MSTAASPAMPAFSYAQAAKGLTPSTAPSSTKEDTSEQNSKQPPARESATADTSRLSRSRPRTEEKDGDEITTNEGTSRTTSVHESTEKENNTPSRRSQQRQEISGNSTSSATSPLLAAEIGSPKEKEFSLRQSGRTDSWEKGSQASNSAEKAQQNGEKEKIKDSEDDWEKVSVPSVAAEKELKAAPLPSVNIWEQRREAQAAKKRELVSQRPPPSSPAPASTSRPKSGGEDSRTKPSGKDTTAKEASPTSRKPAEANKGSGRKESSPAHASRPASQHGDKADAAPVPSVGDAKLWPTPETAGDERRKSTTFEKSERPELKANAPKGHGNKWVHVPFVPTAKFETQLPASAARRGGRPGARGGRDGSGRAGHSNNGEKHDATGSMGPPPLPKHANENDRGRKSEGSRGGRASSVPTGSRRAASRESNTANGRKPSALVGKDQAALEAAVPSIPGIAGQDGTTTRNQAPGIHDHSRSLSHHEGHGADPVLNGEAFVSLPIAEHGLDAFQVPVGDGAAQPSYHYDRSKPFNSNFSRANGEPTRERAAPRNREWSREKSDTAREKVESWKDRENSGESSSRRESRPERGRGGYRGRGNHAYNTFSGSHAYTSPLPQNGFEAPKPAPVSESRSRQASQPFSMAMPPTSSRNGPRSQSIPLGMIYQGYYNNGQGVPQAISPLQPDMSQYGYPPQMSMQPGIMSAIPYNDPLNSYAVLSMVMTQVEYYFSIDNLCKDLFLRRNMDSQGFVPLSVIANFKRIKTLTEENMTLDTLRHVCQQVKTVEYMSGDDGEDRLRRKEGWQDFVLPMEERLPSAKNDGPSLHAHRTQRAPPVPHLATEALSFIPMQSRSALSDVQTANGMYTSTSPHPFTPIPSLDGQTADRQYSIAMQHSAHELSQQESTASPFPQETISPRSPPISQRQTFVSGVANASSGLANGHGRQLSRSYMEDNVFPDEGIPNINIFMRDPSQDGQGGITPLHPSLTRVLSNDSSTGRSGGPEEAAGNASARVSGLRGGAASPEQLARLQGLTFGSSTFPAPSITDSPAFFTKDGQQTQMPPVQPGHFYHTYESLHDTAMQQRAHGVQGALEPMYMFWTNFLVDKFNLGMYHEFQSLAMEDSMEQADSGMRHLMDYYQNMLMAAQPMPSIVAHDLVDMLRTEKDELRPVFKMLRKAWRDGALNLKTRKRIGDYLSDEEKTAFDRGG